MTAVTVLALALVAAACGSSSTEETGAASTATSDAGATTSTTAASTATTAGDEIVNVWEGPAADLTALPIGTAHVSTTGAAVGDLFACDAGNPNGGGAFAVGPWIDEAAGTWDRTEKVAVQGEVSWPMAQYDEQVDGDVRTINSNGLPVDMVTGTFPVAADDPAYSYDRNPNSIAETDLSVTLPASPTVADTPTCLGKGVIGVLRNGVAIFAPVDERNRDAVAYETQDECDGHPQQTSTYHHHDVPSCVLDASTGPSTVVGFAYDGFPIVVERDADGNLPTNADLDECHGRTSSILLDGEVVETYHYSATYEFPYFMGCFRGATA
ncbi:MAG: YHYH protein [Acidimicrobiales bacterium]|nr:YHYH protein [Acidimicrobiales bacterium]